MATTVFAFDAGALVPDTGATLVAGDAAALQVSHNEGPAIELDDTDEMAFLTRWVPAPQGLSIDTAEIYFYPTGDPGDTDGVRIDAYVEAVTPNSDTQDMYDGAKGFDSANSASRVMNGVAEGDPQKLTITLTNKDSVAAGDMVRFGFRRDTDHEDDDYAASIFVTAIEIRES